MKLPRRIKQLVCYHCEMQRCFLIEEAENDQLLSDWRLLRVADNGKRQFYCTPASRCSAGKLMLNQSYSVIIHQGQGKGVLKSRNMLCQCYRVGCYRPMYEYSSRIMLHKKREEGINNLLLLRLGFLLKGI